MVWTIFEDLRVQKKSKYWENQIKFLAMHITRAVTVADFYHRGGNGPTTAGGAVLWYIYIYIYRLYI